jgi:hypothetical protein
MISSVGCGAPWAVVVVIRSPARSDPPPVGLLKLRLHRLAELAATENRSG